MAAGAYQSVRNYLKNVVYSMWGKAIDKALLEQGLAGLVADLERLVPDITRQYSMFEVNTPYLRKKVRGLHAFQILLVNKVIEEFEKVTIVDIGDSSGTHIKYLLGLHSQNRGMHCLSVNLDKKAVERIREKGLEAVCARAEDLPRYNINADIFLCFETLEHLMNPGLFLHELSSKTGADYLIVTVPYLRNSRVGLHHIRGNAEVPMNAENTHIFELDPEDWKVLVRFSGWEIAEEKIFLQYPRRSFFRMLKPLFRKYDFEGFYGLILKRDDTWAALYSDW